MLTNTCAAEWSASCWGSRDLCSMLSLKSLLFTLCNLIFCVPIEGRCVLFVLKENLTAENHFSKFHFTPVHHIHAICNAKRASQGSLCYRFTGKKCTC